MDGFGRVYLPESDSFTAAELNHWGGILHVNAFQFDFFLGQPEPEFRPPMSEVVQAMVRLVQRANMSKRTFSSSDHGGSQRGSDDPVLRDI